MKNDVPTIALSIGDVAGIGPELAAKILLDPEICESARIHFYGPEKVIRQALLLFAPGANPTICSTSELSPGDFIAGSRNPKVGLAAYNTIVTATRDVLDGKADAIVTCPVNKASINEAGIPFTGHTELIASLCHCRNYAMMQSSGDLRVIFVTTHIALRDVADQVTTSSIVRVGRLLHEAIQAEGIPRPRILVCGLNPHAGENGHMGTEEIDRIIPAVSEMRAEGMDVFGPFPPDTVFIEATRKKYDGIISMYHDQGHIPFKMLAFDRGVNSTMGLPIIRTSVDHGTAFDIAWKGCADPGSLKAALRIAIKRANAKKKNGRQ